MRLAYSWLEHPREVLTCLLMSVAGVTRCCSAMLNSLCSLRPASPCRPARGGEPRGGGAAEASGGAGEAFL